MTMMTMMTMMSEASRESRMATYQENDQWCPTAMDANDPRRIPTVEGSEAATATLRDLRRQVKEVWASHHAQASEDRMPCDQLAELWRPWHSHVLRDHYAGYNHYWWRLASRALDGDVAARAAVVNATPLIGDALSRVGRLAIRDAMRDG